MSIVYMTGQEFDLLLEYNTSLPIRVTIGKQWKRRLGSSEKWFLGEYIKDPNSEWVGIKWSKIVIGTIEFRDYQI
jgi:hypothetical protein